jgi:hypothetical protein
LGLEHFGVNTEALNVPVPCQIFHAWVVNWENEVLKKRCPMAEVILPEKYKDILFFDPNNKIHYTVYSKNLEYMRGHYGG